MSDSIDAIQRAVVALSRLPGIGERTATRLTYWLLRAPDGTIAEITSSLEELCTSVHECAICCDLTPSVPCRICSNKNREQGTILVVEQPQDVVAFERSGAYSGSYHILHGAIAPLDGVNPDDLRIRELLARIEASTITEVILATDPNVEGDTTALYIAKLLGPLSISVTRIAHGVSVGSEIEYSDALSLARAFTNRRPIV
jgi:recombination protein RecR